MMHKQPGTPLGGARFHRVRFELTEVLSHGSSAEAKTIVWNPVAAEFVLTEHRITVRDPLEMFSGQPGMRGYATWWGDQRGYECDQMELSFSAPIIYGVLNEDLTAGGSAEITIHDAGGATEETVEIYDNLLDDNHYLPEGRLVWALLHRADGCYYVLQTKGCALEVEE